MPKLPSSDRLESSSVDEVAGSFIELVNVQKMLLSKKEQVQRVHIN